MQCRMSLIAKLGLIAGECLNTLSPGDIFEGTTSLVMIALVWQFSVLGNFPV